MVLWQNKPFCCISYDLPFRTYIAPVESNQAISNNGLLVRAITDILFYTDLIGTMVEIN